MLYVIVLSYRAPEVLRRCIESVLRTDFPSERFRLVVVDNAATEETSAVLQSYAGRIDVLPQRENTGFAGGMNIGIRHALAHGAEGVVLLNQDTEVETDWLCHLVMAMESDKTIGAVQPRIMLGGAADSQNDLVNSIGNEIHVLGFGYAGGHRERWPELRRRLRGFPYPEVTYCSGAAVMFRASALRDVALPRGGSGGAQYLEEYFFMYHEDLDIGVRLLMRGWRNVLAPQSVVHHFYEFSRSMEKLYLMERNRILFLLGNFRWRTLALLAPVLLLSEVGLFALARRHGWYAQKRRAWGVLLHPANWETYRVLREGRRRKRTARDRVIVRRFTSVFANQEMPSAFVERIVNPVITAWWRIVRPLIVW